MRLLRDIDAPGLEVRRLDLAADELPRDAWPRLARGPRALVPRPGQGHRVGAPAGGVSYKPSAKIDKLAGNSFGTEVAKERVDLLDVDRLFLLIDAPARKKLDGDELFSRLDVVREQRVTDLPYATSTQLGAAVAFNSVLSIPYALDGIEKSLEGS